MKYRLDYSNTKRRNITKIMEDRYHADFTLAPAWTS